MTELDDHHGRTVSFTAMEDGTADEYRLLDRFEREHAAGTADRILAALDRHLCRCGSHARVMAAIDRLIAEA